MKNSILNIFKVGIIVTFSINTLSALVFTSSTTNNYNFIYAYGKFIAGDKHRLNRVYNNLPKNKQSIIVFNSRGGELRAGIEVGKFLKNHHIGSAVSKNGICASSCALAFLGGRDLYGRKLMILPHNAKLGYHSFYYKNSLFVSSQKMQEDLSKLLNYFSYVNAPSTLLTKMLNTKSSNMYWITQRHNRYLTLQKGLENYNNKFAKIENTNKYSRANSKLETIKKYFNLVNSAIGSYRNRYYVALNSNSYNLWLAKNLKYVFLKNIKVLKKNRIKTKVEYIFNNYTKICSNNIYKMRHSRYGWEIVSKSIRPCNKKIKLSKNILNNLP